MRIVRREDAYLNTRACLSLTRRTNASVLPSRESSGLLAPPGKESTRRVVVWLVRLVWKIAYMPK